MFTVIDDLGYVYLYKATDTEFFFIESLKHLSSNHSLKDLRSNY